MKRRKSVTKFTVGVLSAAMLVSLPVKGLVVSAKAADGETIIASYMKGDSETGLMARYWFPDAGAGYDADGDGVGDRLSHVREMILDMLEAGFGGCELTMLLDCADFAVLSDEKYAEMKFDGPIDAMDKIGWGSEAWANIIACATDTANQYNAEHGTDFKVDVTITAHWPMIINNLDPNDDEQQQALVYTVQKVTAEDLTNGVELTLPEMKTKDNANTESMTSTFIFKDTLVGSTLAKYTGEVSETSTNFFTKEEVTTNYPTIDFSSMTDVTDGVSAEAAYEAGVPKAEAKHMKLQKNTETGRYEWKYFTSAGEINPSYTDVENYIVLEKGTDKVLAGEYSVDAKTSFGRTDYTVTDQSSGEILGQDTFEVIEPGCIVSMYEDEEGNSHAAVMNAETAEDLKGVLTISNRQLLGDREEMADVQETYQLSGEALAGGLSEEAKAAITQSEGEELQEGDYILINTYRRGTGQVASGGGNVPMPNKTYAVNYFTEGGAQKVIDYWEENLLPHVYTREDGTTATLKEIMQENGAMIFEDSIELSHPDGNLWCTTILDDIQNTAGIDAAKYMPVFAGWRVTGDDAGEANRIEEDYKKVLNDNYSKYHLSPISEWTSTFGYGFRTQCHGIDAVDAGTAAFSTDIAESDNATDGFGTRVYAGAKNINPNNNVISNESLTFGTGFNEFPSWYYAQNTLNRYFSEGVNRVILHGTPYKTSYTKTETADSAWPGWDFSSFMAWNSRQTWWDDVEVFSDYINRVQSVLQKGQSKIPVAILEDASSSNITRINTGVGLSKASLQQLIGEGYNYNILTGGMLESEEASLEVTDTSLSGDKVLSALAEYQVLVLDHISSLSVEAMEKLVSYAQAGLKIVNMGSNINRVYGTDINGSQDAKVQELFAQLQACETYHEITSDDTQETEDDGMTQAQIDLIAYIKENVDSGVSYADAVSTAVNDKGSKWLEATRVYDKTDNTNYYLLYNESAISVGAEQDADFGPGAWEENGDITTTITLSGTGVPYILEPESGDVVAVKDYVQEEGKVSFQLNIQEGDLVVAAVTESQEFADNAIIQETNKIQKETVELGGEQLWNLKLDSYGPDNSAENMDEDGTMIDPTKSAITTLTLETPLCVWENLALTQEQLETLGVEKAAAISGVGEYSIEVEVPDYGTETVGAVFNYEYNKQYNNITVIAVTDSNGESHVFSGINANHDYYDLGTVLKPGKNKITIKVCGDLLNRINKGEVVEAAGMGPIAAKAELSANGITDASLSYYTVE